MKKFLSVILISMLVLTGAFAVETTANMTPSSTAPTTDITSTVVVGLQVEPAAMTSYAFGFSGIEGSVADLGESTNLAKVPTPFDGSLALNYDAAKGIGTTDAVSPASEKKIYMYFKIQAKDPISLDITASKMQDAHAAEIDMYVTGTKGSYSVGAGAEAVGSSFSTDSAGSPVAKITITPTSGIQLNATSYKLKVWTSKLPVLTETANYTGTIKVNVSAG